MQLSAAYSRRTSSALKLDKNGAIQMRRLLFIMASLSGHGFDAQCLRDLVWPAVRRCCDPGPVYIQNAPRASYMGRVWRLDKWLMFYTTGG